MSHKYALLLCSLWLLASPGGFAQDCQPANATIEFTAPKALATLGVGPLWSRGYYLSASQYLEPSAIYRGNFWIGGIDAGNTLRLAAYTYGAQAEPSGGNAGPLSAVDGTPFSSSCIDFDRFWAVTAEEVANFRADLADGNLDGSHPAVFAWPGRENPLSEFTNGFSLPPQPLAPFVDTDGDGIYNPQAGDYPAIKGNRSVWWVFNTYSNAQSTESAPYNTEIHALAYAIDGMGEAIDNTTFYEFEFTNRMPFAIDSTTIGLWVDADLGCFDDDFAGCLPADNLVFLYNGDEVDGNINCSCEAGVLTYCQAPPMLGIRLLEGGALDGSSSPGLSSFIAYNNSAITPFPPGTADPTTALQIYRLLNATWPDGEPLTTGGDGYQDGAPTSYLFAGNPAEAGEWSMCSEGLSPTDVRFLLNTGPFQWQPGQRMRLAYALTGLRGVAYPCPDAGPLADASRQAQEAYDGLLSPVNDPAGRPSARIFPNPAHQTAHLRLTGEGVLLQSASLASQQGQLLREWRHIDAPTLEIGRQGLPPGLYFLQAQLSNGEQVVGKVVFE